MYRYAAIGLAVCVIGWGAGGSWGGATTAHSGDEHVGRDATRETREKLAEKARGHVEGDKERGEGGNVGGHEAMVRWVAEVIQRRALARSDGYVYTVDLAQLMSHMAVIGRHDLYRALRAELVEHVVIDQRDDPYTQGFVRWRFKLVKRETLEGKSGESTMRSGDDAGENERKSEGKSGEESGGNVGGVGGDVGGWGASGTTEALRLAEALWRGAEAFGNVDDVQSQADRALARLIVAGYVRHATVENGVWYVRNYFNLDTRAWANNSFMVDYDPDLLAEIARESGDIALSAFNEQCVRLVRRAVTKGHAPRNSASDIARKCERERGKKCAGVRGGECGGSVGRGLIYPMVQPEIMTLQPDGQTVIFAPNDVVQLGNVATVAWRVRKTAPDVAAGFYAWVKRVGLDDLHTHHLGRTGQPVPGSQRLNDQTWALLLRLAIWKNEPTDIRAIQPRVRRMADDFLARASEARVRANPKVQEQVGDGVMLYTASELLPALWALRAWEDR